MRAERFVEAGASLGEGPVWRSETGEILWVDILAGRVHATDLSGNGRVEAAFACPVGAVVLLSGGAWRAAVPGGIARLDGSLVAELPIDAPDLRMNDGKADPEGRYVGGTMTVGQPRDRAGSLWMLDGSGSTRLVNEVTISNGLCWSANGDALFWTDTPSGRIDVFDRDPQTGLVTNRRPWVRIPTDVGSPDGMCIDAEGGLWVALWAGSAVHRYVDGLLDAVVEVGTPFVTCPAFVGEDLDQLVVTTASTEFTEPAAGAGDLYLADVGIVGVDAHRLGSWAT